MNAELRTIFEADHSCDPPCWKTIAAW